MFGILFCYVLYFTFFLKSTFMGLYVSTGLITLALTWFILKNIVSLEKLMTGYLIIAPLYIMPIILVFWSYSVTNFVWLIPMPIGAYIFLASREVIAYSLYALFIVIAVSLIAVIITPLSLVATPLQIKISDTFLFIANIIIAGHLLSYKDKIRSLQIITKIEAQEKIELPVTLSDKEIEQYNDLFDQIEGFMEERHVFKNPDFNITSLSSMLKVSTSYASRAIRYSEYANFNNYLNSKRIQYVIQLIHTADLEKVTLLYIYSEAGYKNQSTFNAAFKKLRGVTPSEYIRNVKDSSDMT